MAYITFENSTNIIESQEEVATFLASNDVIYEHWDINQLPEALREKYNLTNEEKQQILDVFSAEIADISARRNYQSADVISLSPDTPNLEELLVNFQREHHHTDDEVRFIVSGHGIFVIQGTDGEFFKVNLNPGDLISVPESTRHYFTLAEDRQTVAVRIFVTTEGWVPVYEKA